MLYLHLNITIKDWVGGIFDSTLARRQSSTLQVLTLNCDNFLSFLGFSFLLLNGEYRVDSMIRAFYAQTLSLDEMRPVFFFSFFFLAMELVNRPRVNRHLISCKWDVCNEPAGRQQMRDKPANTTRIELTTSVVQSRDGRRPFRPTV